ncbi:MAG: BamA/TamA family outer membrane protein, partial [Pseudomonadota bacterium]
IGYEIAENLRQRWTYDFSRREVTDVRSDASVVIQRLEGSSFVSEIGQSLTYDTRDSRFRPTEGFYAELSATAAGLGGNTNYVRGTLGAGYYYPLFERDVILSATGEIGVSRNFDGSGSFIDSFFHGGQSVRGFENFGIGPRDPGSDDAIGGQNFFAGTLQASFPLGFPEELGVRGRSFVDFGSLWSVDDTGLANLNGVDDGFALRASGGVGVTWDSPFGPIAIDYAFPFAKEDFDQTENIRFSFGTTF